MFDKTDIESFRDFWPYYLSEHASSGSRALNVIGTATALAFLILLSISGNLWFLLCAVAAGYGFAWGGHFAIERNRPATFRYPVWSLMGDFCMCSLTITGRLGCVLQRHKISAVER
ncbi:MAG: DUF962 domain-containing protein [Alphaproteobacteria bacterium]